MSAKRWTVTVNNYTDDDVENIKTYCTERNCRYAIFGKEIGDKGTLHLQGFVHLHRKVRISTVKKNISKTGHYEIAKGSDEQNKDYCSKQGAVLLEVGKPAPKPGTNTRYVDALELANKIAEGESLYEMVANNENYLGAYLRHSRTILDIVEERNTQLGKEAFDKRYGKELQFYDWQKELYRMLTTEEPHERKIFWYVDYVGGAGKSTFVNYFLTRHKSVCFFGGKINDLSYAYNYEPVVFFDLSRSGFNDYLMGFMEQVKNGRVFSSKYKSKMKYFASPHVVVFSNKLPDDGVFSCDRLHVIDVTNMQ